MLKKPFARATRARGGALRNGLFYFLAFSLALTSLPSIALAADGPTEALEMRFQAEKAIAQERTQGHAALADAMQGVLPSLLQEYLITRDGTIAMDAVDGAFVQEQFKLARAMEEPGVALALDVFSGPGTGYEHGLRTALAGLAGFSVSGRKAGPASEAAIDALDRQLDNHLEAKLDTATARLESNTDRSVADRSVTAGATVSVEPSVKVEVTAGATVEAAAKTVTAINTITVTPGNGPAEVSNNNPSSEKKGGPP